MVTNQRIAFSICNGRPIGISSYIVFRFIQIIPVILIIQILPAKNREMTITRGLIPNQTNLPNPEGIYTLYFKQHSSTMNKLLSFRFLHLNRTRQPTHRQVYNGNDGYSRM